MMFLIIIYVAATTITTTTTSAAAGGGTMTTVSLGRGRFLVRRSFTVCGGGGGYRSARIRRTATTLSRIQMTKIP